MTPYEVVRYEDGVPFFRGCDIENYGLPDQYGVDVYHVIAERIHFGRDFRTVYFRPVHYYCRVKRFTGVLRSLLGGKRSAIEWGLMDVLHKVGFDHDPSKVWDSVRGVLKKYGFTSYYNRIPDILTAMRYNKRIIGTVPIEEMVFVFQKIHVKFDSLDHGPLYFPNLRYIALRIMMLVGYVFEYDIPLLRTKRLLPIMDELWNELFS